LAFRRLGTIAKAEGFAIPFDVHYYNPGDVKKLSSGKFDIKYCAPVGLFLPPSFMERFFKSRTRLLNFLNSMEKKIGRSAFLSLFSDHYIIQLKKTN
jgi:hypothetical protein